jgi:hypothetical protein
MVVWPIALCVAEAFMGSNDESGVVGPRAFVYLSAEDIFRPFIPARYIETKREAEAALQRMAEAKTDAYRTVYLRPSACPPANKPASAAR